MQRALPLPSAPYRAKQTWVRSGFRWSNRRHISGWATPGVQLGVDVCCPAWGLWRSAGGKGVQRRSKTVIPIPIPIPIPQRRWMSKESPPHKPPVWEDREIDGGVFGLSHHKMGVRIFRAPKVSESMSTSIPVLLFFPSGLPVYISREMRDRKNLGPLLITEKDHVIAALLAESSKHTVIVPGFFKGSSHIVEQLKPKVDTKEAEADKKEKDKAMEYLMWPDMDPAAFDYAGEVLGDAAEDYDLPVLQPQDPEAKAAEVMAAEAKADEKYMADQAAQAAKLEEAVDDFKGKWVYPYPKHPVAIHYALRAYYRVMEHLPSLLNLSNPKIPQEVSLCMSGSLVGAGLASSIALSEFKHPPFTTGVTINSEVPTGPGEKAKLKRLTVELKSLALVTPLVNWCFEPLGAYDFSSPKKGKGGGWILPPIPQLPETPSDDPAKMPTEGGPYLLPAPTLPTLLRLRSAYFTTPEDYIDPFASPLFFMQTPGIEVGRDSLEKLWIGLRPAQTYSRPPKMVDSPKFRWQPRYFSKKNQINVVTMEGTKRRTVGRRWPPPWGKSQVQEAEPRRGGLPRKGRIRVVVPAEGETEDGLEAIWGQRENNEKEKAAFQTRMSSSASPTGGPKPTPVTSISHKPPAPTKPRAPEPSPKKDLEIISEHAEYAKDHTSAESYDHSPHMIHLLQTPPLLLSRLTTPPLATRAAGWWLVRTANEFVDCVERSWRYVVSSDFKLRYKLAKEAAEKVEARNRELGVGGGARRGILAEGGGEKGEEVSEEEASRRRKIEERVRRGGEVVDSMLVVVGSEDDGVGGVGRKEKDSEREKRRRIKEEMDAIVGLGKWVAEVEPLP